MGDRRLNWSFLPLHKEAFFVFLGQSVSAIGTLVGVKLLTGQLSPEIYGLVALGMSIVNLFGYFLGASIGCAATRFFRLAVEDRQLISYEHTLIGIGRIIAGIFLTITLGLLIVGRLFYALISLFSLLLCIDAIFNGIQTGARNRRTVALMQALLNWSRFLWAVGLIVWFGRENIELVFAGFCISGLLNIALQGYFYRRKIRAGAYVSTDVRAVGFSRQKFYIYLRPLAVSGLISWGQLFIDRWSLSMFSTLKDVGIYFALYQISYAPVLLLSACIFNFIAPILFEKAGDAEDMSCMKKVYSYNELFSGVTLVLAVILAGVMATLHDLVGEFLLGPRYVNHTYLLPWMVLTGGIYATGSQLLLSIQSNLNLRSLLVQKIISAGIALLCYILGTYWMGLAGAVWGGLVFSTIHFLTAFGFHRQLLEKQT